MKHIPLTKGKYAIVDDSDYDELSKHKWMYSSTYAIRWSPRPNRHFIFMHRVINKTPDGFVTDHINGDPLDNRRSNLRSCTQSQNHMNKLKLSNNTSGYKGVFWHKTAKRWRAQITLNSKAKHLGYFGSPEEAHRAYNQAARKLFKDFNALDSRGISW